METFAKRIIRLRTERGLTQKGVARALAVPLSTYKEWEYGRRIQGEHIYIKLAEVLEISLRDLLTGESNSAKNAALVEIDLAIRQMEAARKSLLSSL